MQAPHALDQRAGRDQRVEEGARLLAVLQRRPGDDRPGCAGPPARALRDPPRLQQRVGRLDLDLQVDHRLDLDPRGVLAVLGQAVGLFEDRLPSSQGMRKRVGSHRCRCASTIGKSGMAASSNSFDSERQMGDVIGEIVLLGYLPDQDQMIGHLTDAVGVGKLQNPRQMAILQEMVGEMTRHAGTVGRDEHVAVCLKPDQYLRIERADWRGNAVADSMDGKFGGDLGESPLQGVRDVLIEQIASESTHVAADTRRFASSRARARARRRCIREKG